jgi:membrane-bound lytic murein transglycosylase D
MDTIYIARLNALMSPVPLKYNYEVRNAIDRFVSPAYAPKMSYAYYYFPMIEEELIRAGLPVELRTLAFVESGLNPLAESRAGAKGLWQFMPSTGKEYGLEINSLVDERCNPRLATRAACQYLKRMYDAYGDWTLAIASYNCGPGNVNKAIMRSGGDPREYNGSFWDVYDRLPYETRNYVPLYMGATYAFAYHKAHGVEYPVPDMPLAVDTIMINRPLHLEQVSSTIDIDIELLKILNPEYLLSIIPATTKSYPLTLPVEYVSHYLANEEEIHSKDTTYLKEYTIHANLDKKKMEAPPAKYHTVKRGETLGAIARKYGRTVKQLMNWNNIKNANTLRVGQRLRVSAS